MLSLLALPALAGLASAQLIAPVSVPSNASTLQLEEVDAMYKNEGFDGTDPTTAFGVGLASQAILTVNYAGTLVQADAPALSQQAVSQQPTVLVTPSSASASNFSSSTVFTLMLADASSLGSPDPEGNYRHFLANGVTPGTAQGGNLTVQVGGGTTITDYAGPGPASGQGPHRYAWLLFQQPSTFAAPANLSQAGTSSGHWSVSGYASDAKLGPLVAAAFFTVEVGPASYSAGPTSTVNPSTLPAASETGSGASPSSTGGSDSGSGAGHLAVGAAGTAAMGVAAVLALAVGM